MKSEDYFCPICRSSDLIMRYEASYVYSYVIDSDAPGLNNSEEFMSYLYDKREQKDTRTFIECRQCGTQYPSTFLNGILNQCNNNSSDYCI
ncbi:MAG TPA: hypothetical protein VJ888_10290 [Mobilitalea sp.]|nr:hypothetical protein [Mobilitalea sp.]